LPSQGLPAVANEERLLVFVRASMPIFPDESLSIHLSKTGIYPLNTGPSSKALMIYHMVAFYWVDNQ